MKAINVLLIEDDAEDAALISHYLSPHADDKDSFALKHVDRLAAGCKLLAQERFDAVLLDLILPGGVGIEAFLKVREQRPEVPIVVLTGLKDESLALQAVALGAQDYLVKGTIDDRVLKRAVRYAIERARLSARSENLLSRDTDGKLVIDAGGLVRYMNPAAEAALGKKAKDLLGKPLPDPEPAERTLERRAVELEWDGAPATLLTLRDVTDIKRAEKLREEILERASVLDGKNEFIASVSHELRNPMTTVRTALQSLREGLVGPLSAQQLRFVDMAYRNVERQIRIINNVLDLTRLQSGRVKIEPRPVSVAQILEDAAAGYRLASGAPKLDFQLAPDLPEALGDADLIAQVVGNLLDNAERFARSRVTLKAAFVEHEGRPVVEVSVSDDGPGISEQQMGRLFSRYVQAARSAGPGGYKGTGLGLAISKEIVGALGGSIWADSVVGKGSRFRFVVPAAAASQPVKL
jgi:signal transduction histidine kinase/DNA-binding response OmpR family regulator